MRALQLVEDVRADARVQTDHEHEGDMGRDEFGVLKFNSGTSLIIGPVTSRLHTFSPVFRGPKYKSYSLAY